MASSDFAIGHLAASELDEVVVCDTIPLSDEARQSGKIRQVTTAPLLAETFTRIVKGDSIMSLFAAPGVVRADELQFYVMSRAGEFEVDLEPRSTIRILPYGLASAQAVDKIGADNYKGTGLAVEWVEVLGPLHDTWPPASHRQIFGDLPQAPSDSESLPPRNRRCISD